MLALHDLADPRKLGLDLQQVLLRTCDGAVTSQRFQLLAQGRQPGRPKICATSLALVRGLA